MPATIQTRGKGNQREAIVMAGPPDSDTTNRRRSNKSPAHLFEFTLAQLPELDLFPSEEMRQIAFERIARQAGSSLRSIAAGILICAGAAGTVVFGLRWLIPLLPFPAGINRWLAALAPGIGGIATFLLVVRYLHRHGYRAALRRELLDQGVPICRPCGYLLRGLSAESKRCPECGRLIEDRIRAILDAESRRDRSDSATEPRT